MALTRTFLQNLGLDETKIEAILAGAGADGEDWQARCEQAEQALADLKAEAAAREDAEKVKEAYRGLLRRARVDVRRFDVILRATDLTGLSLDGAGELRDAEALLAQIRRDWGDFIVSTGRRGAAVATPPGSGPAPRTSAEIMAIQDARERQRAIAENHELFGF